ncbi:electron transport complex subunit E [Ruminobacter amylophilus]|uniref:electron transport complex subunit E n=1 Tax=Ruminobacter amylophilus TaxID=867 RepID=UPI003870A5A4
MFDKISEIFKDGLWNKNPGLVQLLGLCPLLAVTSTAANALGLGIATIAVLTISNLLISAVRRLLKAEVRIIIYVIIIASVVTCVQLCMQAYTAELYEALGLYISLIVTNCIIIARAEIFASRNSVFYSALDGFANGLGFTAVLLFIGGVREIIGKGTLFSGMDQLIGESGRNLQINIFSADDGLLIAILPPGAFITLGLLVAAKNYLDNRLYIKNSSKKRDSESTIVTE